MGLGSRMEGMVDMGIVGSRREVGYLAAKGNQGNVVEAECKLGMAVLIFQEEKAQPGECGHMAARKERAQSVKVEIAEYGLVVAMMVRARTAKDQGECGLVAVMMARVWLVKLELGGYDCEVAMVVRVQMVEYDLEAARKVRVVTAEKDLDVVMKVTAQMEMENEVAMRGL